MFRFRQSERREGPSYTEFRSILMGRDHSEHIVRVVIESEEDGSEIGEKEFRADISGYYRFLLVLMLMLI